MFDQLWETPKDKLAWFKILMKAEEMHKEQITDAYNHGQQIPPFEYAEKYYQKTYNDNK